MPTNFEMAGFFSRESRVHKGPQPSVVSVQVHLQTPVTALHSCNVQIIGDIDFFLVRVPNGRIPLEIDAYIVHRCSGCQWNPGSTSVVAVREHVESSLLAMTARQGMSPMSDYCAER